eukprot:2816070-Ditylum_brightwellii.AAC.2
MDESAAIVIDTGTSKLVPYDLSDFIGPIEPLSLHTLAGVSEKTQVKGEGCVRWHVRDDYGHI